MDWADCVDELQTPRTAIVGCCDMRVAVGLDSLDMRAALVGELLPRPLSRLGELLRRLCPCEGSAWTAVAAPFRGGSGTTLLPLTTPLGDEPFLEASSFAARAGGAGDTLQLALVALGVISSDTQARREARPEASIVLKALMSLRRVLMAKKSETAFKKWRPSSRAARACRPTHAAGSRRRSLRSTACTHRT